MDDYLRKLMEFEKNWKPDMTEEEMAEIRKKNLGPKYAV